MPDLIIKPTNTEGNRVIIQDQAGGAVLTTADSGATFSGGNIGTVTAGVLNSGVTGGSGLNALSAVSMGKLLNETTVSSSVASVEFIHGTGGVDFSSTYNGYVVVLHNVKITSANSIYMRVGKSSGYDTSNRCVKWRLYGTGGNITNDTAFTTSYIFDTVSFVPANATAISAEARIYFSNISDAVAPDVSYAQIGISAGNTQATSGEYDRIGIYGLNNWTAGTFQLWGTK
jgi:hypothetical protein